MSAEKCRWCGLIHETKCLLVKAIDYAEDGITVRHVEFFAPKDYQLPYLQPIPYYQPQTYPPLWQQWTTTTGGGTRA